MKRSVQILALLGGLVLATAAHAKGPKGYDAFAEAPALSARADLALQATRAGGVIASLDDKRGVPSLLWAIGTQAASPLSFHPEAAAVHHLLRFRRVYGLPHAALSTTEVVQVHDIGRGGIIVKLRQVLDGVELYHSDVRVLLRRNLDLLAISGSLHPAATPVGKPGTRVFAVQSAQAVASSFRDLFGVSVTAADMIEISSSPGGYLRFVLMPTADVVDADLGLRMPARVKRIYYPLPDELVPAYFVELLAGRQSETSSEAYQYVIAADDGRLLRREDLAKLDAFEYRVWADATGDHRPADAPQEDFSPHPTGVPDPQQPAFIAPELISMEGFNTNPNGQADPWLPANAEQTLGNNVDAYADLTAPDHYSNGDMRATTTSDQSFDRIYDPLADPDVSDDQIMAATTQLFYVNNWLHDWYYDSGFDEAAGNAQDDNLGRGGLEADVLLAEAHDYSGTNNANMNTPADGVSPRMQMFLNNPLSDRWLDLTPGGTIDPIGRAQFGALTYDITADLVLVDDGTDPVTDGCEAIATNLTGVIALIDRHDCPFAQKAANAEAAGALGVLIANDIPGGGVLTMASPDPPIPVNIPSLMITYEAGEAVKQDLLNGPVVAHMLGQAESQMRNTALEGSIVSHEWGHYQYGRLSAGGLVAYPYGQHSATHEGFADFTALHMMVREGDDLDGSFAVGTYSFSYAGNPYFGLRRMPYSVDFNKNGLTFRHISAGEPLPAVPNTGATENQEAHSSGEIWASMMFEAYIALLKQTEQPNPPYGFDEARRRMSDYMVAGMKLQPIGATLTETRDALLAAALAADPDDAAILAEAFARRGAGSCAVSPPRLSEDLVGVVESYELDPKAEIGSIQVTDSVDSCDGDSFLDGDEVGEVTVDISNVGFATLSGAQLTVTSATPGVSFPAGGTVTVPDISPVGVMSPTVAIALDDSFSAISVLELEVTLTAPDACEATVLAQFSTRIHLDDLPGTSAVDNVEGHSEAWTKAGDAGGEVWSRLELDPTDHAWHGLDHGAQSDTALESPDLEVSSSDDFVISFEHIYDFEVTGSGTPIYWDGGLVEISDDGGTTWTDLSTYVDPGYDGVITDNPANVIANMPAYTGQNPSYPAPDTVSLDLGSTFAGQTVRFRFRIGTDGSVGAPGWVIDNIGFDGITNTPFATVVPHQGNCQEPPVADAGPDQTVESGDGVTLDGSGSSDPNGDELTISWLQVDGFPQVTLATAPDGVVVFVAPEVDTDTVLTFQVEAHDGVASDTDTMEVIVQPPGGSGGSGAGGTGGSGGSGGAGGAAESPTILDPEGGCDCGLAGGTRGPARGGLALALLGLAALRRRRQN